ncbi:MAG: hypothetical protein WCR56_07215 [Bacilli bacterium]|jgi:hypothetical protein
MNEVTSSSKRSFWSRLISLDKKKAGIFSKKKSPLNLKHDHRFDECQSTKEHQGFEKQQKYMA